MREIVYGFILGLVQGLTEFLPVSSSGHLALLERLGVGDGGLFFNLALHFATLLAVLTIFRREVIYLLKHPLSERSRFILIASIPTAVLAGLIRYILPDTTAYLPFFFALTSVLLALPSFMKAKPWAFGEKGLVKRALFTGFMQGIACLNGISRSGATVSALNLSGVDKADSAEISFLLSIPIIVGSALVEILSGGAEDVNIGALIVGSVTAFIVGLLALKTFIKILQKRKLWIFSIYTFLMAIASFFLLY